MSKTDPAVSMVERIDALCDRFEAAWKTGRRPDLAGYLEPIDGEPHTAAFAALLSVEIELRAKAGEQATAADYRGRFPELAKVVDQVFDEWHKRPAATVDTSVSGESVRAGNPAGAAAKTGRTPLPKKIGRFEVQELLGEGGFGKVYKARDPQLDRAVAIKVPQRGTLDTSEEAERFLREARTAANLHHPNLCPVHEIGDADGGYFIVMAYVDGKSLATTLKERTTPLPARQAALILRKLALALSAAHAKGIIHRDLKPSNIMIDRERKDVVIMDFGLARRRKQGDAKLTQEGAVMGTPAYMAPEQARGDIQAIGPASDVYGLGVILYEMLAGKVPFSGSVNEVIGKVLHVEPAAPSTHRTGVDSQLEAICMKAMAKAPAERFVSMKALADALDEFLKGNPGSESVKPTKAPGSESGQLTKVAQALSAERKEETRAAIEEAVRRARIPLWQWLVGAGFLATVIVTGIIFFARTPTATVLISIEGLDIKDATLAFFLDEKNITSDELQRPIELKVGDHWLVVLRAKEEVRRYRFVVLGGRDPGIQVTETRPGPGGQIAASPSAGDPDALAADWVLRAEGTLVVLADKLAAPVKVAADLPKSPYHVTDIRFEWGNPKVTDEGLAYLKGLKKLKSLHLGGIPITDKGLKYLADSNSLESLAIDSTRIGDSGLQLIGKLSQLKSLTANGIVATNEGIAHLKNLRELRLLWLMHMRIDDTAVSSLAGLTALETLALYDTEVTDKGLAHLTMLKNLRDLNLGKTKATQTGLRNLQKALPKCRITPDPDAANNDGFTSLFNGMDLTGWQTHPQEPGNWRVENGNLVGSGDKPNHLFTMRGDYTDIHVRAEVQIGPGGNSGVSIRAAFEAKPGLGYEANIASPGQFHKTGALFATGRSMTVPIKEDLIPADTWFTLDNVVVGNRVVIRVNGSVVVDYIDKDRTHQRGHVALQMHDRNTTVRFRKIQVRELKPGDPLFVDPIAPTEGFVPLFNGKDLTGWEGLPGAWQLDSGSLVGVLPPGHDKNTFLCSKALYRDFELSFQVKLKNGNGNSGVQIRSNLLDREGYRVAGPQVEIDALNSMGGLYAEGSGKGWLRKVTEEVVRRVFKPAEFNDYFIRVVGKRVKIVVNAETLVDDDFPDMADDGIIAFQLHGKLKVDEVTFRNVLIRDLTPKKDNVPPADPDRAAVGRVLAMKGRVEIDWNGNKSEIATAKEIPSVNFKLVGIYLPWEHDVAKAGGLGFLRTLSHLRRLKVSYGNLAPGDLETIASLSTLEYLEMFSVPVKDTDLALIGKLTNLQELDLGNNAIGPGLQHLAGLTKMRVLHLYRTSVADADLAVLVNMRELKAISVEQTRVTGSAFAGLTRHTQLESINAHACPLNVEGATAIAELPALKTLWAYGSTLDDDAVTKLAESTSLKELRLDSCKKLTDVGILKLVRLKSLTSVNLEKTAVSSNVLRQLKEALPKCTILPAPPADPDRAAAELVQTLGGQLTVRVGNNPNIGLKKGDQLPTSSFRIRVVNLDGRKGVTDKAVAQLRLDSLSELIEINLTATAITDAGLVHLRHAKSLQRILLCRIPIKGPGLAHLAELPKLRSLELDGYPQFTNAGMPHLRQLTRITHLSLCMNFDEINDAGLANLESLTNLETLELMQTNVSGTGFVRLKVLTKLKHLDLRFTPISNEGLAAIAALPALESMWLTGAKKFTSAGLKAFRGNTTLRSLRLFDTEVTDAAVPDLATLTGLKELNLEKTRVTAEGVEKLRAALPNCRIHSEHLK